MIKSISLYTLTSRSLALTVFIAALIASSMVSLSLSIGFAEAAPDGCYTAAASSSGRAVSYSPTNCPAEKEQIVNQSSGRCFINSSADRNNFIEKKCNTFEVGGTSTQPAPQTAANGGADIDEIIEADCTAEEELNSGNCGIIRYLVILINVLSGIAGLVIVGSVMIAGYTYMTARDNAGQIMKAKMRIVWTLAALALYVFMYGFLNYLIPGGVF